jgi:integrase
MVEDETVGALPQKGEAEVCALDELFPGVDRNATEAVKPPQVRREEMRPLAPEQVKVLLQATRDERLEALYVLAVTTGLRQGELLVLKWEDVDLEAVTLQVRWTLATAKGGTQLTGPKTKGSRRTVRLAQSTVNALRSRLERQLGEIIRRAARGGRTASYSPQRRATLWTVAT